MADYLLMIYLGCFGVILIYNGDRHPFAPCLDTIIFSAIEAVFMFIILSGGIYVIQSFFNTGGTNG